MERLHIDPLIGQANESINAHQWHDVLDFEVLHYNWLFSMLLESSFVKLCVPHLFGEVVVLEYELVQIVLIGVSLLLVEEKHISQCI